MPKKTQIEEQFEAGEQVDTQELAAAMSTTPKSEEKKKAGKYIAYAAFELFGKQYQEGDEFVPPADFVRDVKFDEFRSMEKKTTDGTKLGLAFMAEGQILNAKTREREYVRHILPIAEV